MLSRKDVSEMAEVFREMAAQAIDPGLRAEFSEGAERYATVASLIERDGGTERDPK